MDSPAKQGSSDFKNTAKGVLILILLMVAAGTGGYFFGTYQKFAPIQSVPAGTPGALVPTTTSQTTTTASSTSGQPLKKKYWIHSSGDQHVGYSITVAVNGQTVEKIYSPGRDVDITKYVKPGENQVTFQADVLPESMNEHKGQDGYYLVLAVASDNTISPSPRESDVLINYKRTAREASDNKAFNDTLTFLTME